MRLVALVLVGPAPIDVAGHRGHDRNLVPKRRIDRSFRHARFLCDGPDRGLRIATGHEEPVGGTDDGQPGLEGLLFPQW